MENQDQDKLMRLYTRLSALKNNLSKDHGILDTFVKEYYTIVNELVELTGLNLDEFKIPMSEVKPYLIGRDYDGQKTYTEEIFCNGSLFFSKFDALMTYFQIKYLSKENMKIGFNTKE
ncbi:MAG: hypothetical protein WAV46_00645 [Candidatus Moraniibacteriota bacterium]